MNPAGRVPHVENVWAGRDLLVGDWLNIGHPSVSSQLLGGFPTFIGPQSVIRISAFA